MRRIFLIAVFCVSFVFSPLVQAQYAPDADAFLWKISKSGRPDSYLLGTIHVGRVDDVLPDAYRQALSRVSLLVVESDADRLSPEEAQAMLRLMHDPRSLQQTLGKRRVSALQGVLAKGQEFIAFDDKTTVKPWALWLTVQSQFSPKGYSHRYGIDNLLIQTASTQGQTILPLESIEPLHYFNALPEAAVIRALDGFRRHHQAFLQDEVNLLQDYRRQRARKVWAEISNPAKQLRYFPRQDRALWHTLMYRQLLTKRNQQWLPTLIEVLPKQPTLVAVGAAHLFGEQGLIRRLRQVGYQVEAVNVPAF